MMHRDIKVGQVLLMALSGDRLFRVRRNLTFLRELSGMSQIFVARALGVRPGTMSAWEGGGKGTPPGLSSLEKLADFHGVSLQALLDEELSQSHAAHAKNANGDGTKGDNLTIDLQSERHISADVPAPVLAVLPQNVPVYSTLGAVLAGDFSLTDVVIDRAPRHPGIANAMSIFALWVRGSTMYPRFSDGDLIYVHPDRVPKPGDNVLIEFEPGIDGTRPAIIRHLVEQTADEIVVEQFNPRSVLILKASTVIRMCHILTVAGLSGFA